VHPVQVSPPSISRGRWSCPRTEHTGTKPFYFCVARKVKVAKKVHRDDVHGIHTLCCRTCLARSNVSIFLIFLRLPCFLCLSSSLCLCEAVTSAFWVLPTRFGFSPRDVWVERTRFFVGLSQEGAPTPRVLPNLARVACFL